MITAGKKELWFKPKVTHSPSFRSYDILLTEYQMSTVASNAHNTVSLLSCPTAGGSESVSYVPPPQKWIPSSLLRQAEMRKVK
jgi:hypothetical protein